MLTEYEKFIAQQTWTFAKTMPEIPHEYVVRDRLSAEDKKVFDAFDDHVESAGYTAVFYEREYTYLDVSGYKYWVMGNILNRAKLG